MKQADEINGKLNALVKGKFDKAGKGPGKGGGGKAGQNGAAPMQVDHSQKDCYHCGEYGHIAANCTKSKGGKNGKGDKGWNSKGDRAGKGSGKYGKGGKGGSKGGKNGWPPSLQTWRTWYPGPSPNGRTGGNKGRRTMTNSSKAARACSSSPIACPSCSSQIGGRMSRGRSHRANKC